MKSPVKKEVKKRARPSRAQVLERDTRVHSRGRKTRVTQLEPRVAVESSSVLAVPMELEPAVVVKKAQIPAATALPATLAQHDDALNTMPRRVRAYASRLDNDLAESRAEAEHERRTRLRLEGELVHGKASLRERLA